MLPVTPVDKSGYRATARRHRAAVQALGNIPLLPLAVRSWRLNCARRLRDCLLVLSFQFQFVATGQLSDWRATATSSLARQSIPNARGMLSTKPGQFLVMRDSTDENADT